MGFMVIWRSSAVIIKENITLSFHWVYCISSYCFFFFKEMPRLICVCTNYNNYLVTTIKIVLFIFFRVGTFFFLKRED